MAAEYRDPYANVDRYDRIRPRYRWEGSRCEREIVRKALGAVAKANRGPFSLAVEVGCGSGRFTPLVTEVARWTIATDPSGDMARAASQRMQGKSCSVRTASAAAVVASGAATESTLVCAFWSLSYALTSFLELVRDREGRIVQQVSNDEAEGRIRGFLEGLLPAQGGKRRSAVIVFFDERSAEQRWVTQQWQRCAPLPGGRRDFTWLKLKEHLERLANRGDRIRIETVRGALHLPRCKAPEPNLSGAPPKRRVWCRRRKASPSGKCDGGVPRRGRIPNLRLVPTG